MMRKLRGARNRYKLNLKDFSNTENGWFWKKYRITEVARYIGGAEINGKWVVGAITLDIGDKLYISHHDLCDGGMFDHNPDGFLQYLAEHLPYKLGELTPREIKEKQEWQHQIQEGETRRTLLMMEHGLCSDGSPIGGERPPEVDRFLRIGK